MRQPQVPSGRTRPSTIRERLHCIINLRQSLGAGDTAKQLTQELRTCNPDEQRMALEELGGTFRVHIPAEVSLAFKVDVNIPWSKLRTMRRYTYIQNKINTKTGSAGTTQSKLLIVYTNTHCTLSHAQLSTPHNAMQYVIAAIAVATQSRNTLNSDSAENSHSCLDVCSGH